MDHWDPQDKQDQEESQGFLVYQVLTVSQETMEILANLDPREIRDLKGIQVQLGSPAQGV